MDESIPAPSDNEMAAIPDQGGRNAAELAAELARIRERLAFYESFDALIQDNVQRSGDLLRRLAAEQEDADQKLRAMQGEVDRRLAEQRSVIEDMVAGISGLRSSLDDMSSRLSAALEALPRGHSSPAAGRLAAIANKTQDATRGQGEGRLAVADGEPAVIAGPGTPAPPPALSAGRAVPVQHETPTASTAESDGSRRPGLAPLSEPAPTGSPAAPAPARVDRLDVIIHGVPNAATALALQRHLQGLPGVDGVEVREYVSGVLRFQVLAPTLNTGDLKDWPGGLELITTHGQVLELKLPTAEGF